MGQDKGKHRESGHRNPEIDTPWWISTQGGNFFTILAAVAIQFSIIFLPLVGPAGSTTPHASKNMGAWLSIILLAVLFSGVAFYSKMTRRKQDASPTPFWSPMLLLASLALLVAWATGWLQT